MSDGTIVFAGIGGGEREAGMIGTLTRLDTVVPWDRRCQSWENMTTTTCSIWAHHCRSRTVSDSPLTQQSAIWRCSYFFHSFFVHSHLASSTLVGTNIICLCWYWSVIYNRCCICTCESVRSCCQFVVASTIILIDHSTLVYVGKVNSQSVTYSFIHPFHSV